MATLELVTALGDAAQFSVRHFSLEESVSVPFSLRIRAHSPQSTLDLAKIVGQPARFRIHAGIAHTFGMGERVVQGVVWRAEQTRALSTDDTQAGVSTYSFEIVARLQLLSQRRSRRIFQHVNIPDIVDKFLDEWHVPHTWRINRTQHPKLEFKVQHDESDLDFVSRLLEEAGIAYTFIQEGQTTLVALHDKLESEARRPGQPLPYVDNPNQSSEREFVTRVYFDRNVKPGAVTTRDHDFRKPAFHLFTDARDSVTAEDFYEQYHYHPGGFSVVTGNAEGTPVADDRGFSRHDARYGADLSQRMLDATRVGIRRVAFETNAYDIAPGSIVSIDAHPHTELSSSREILVVGTKFAGGSQGDWKLSVDAVFADAPYRPPFRTAKPVVQGIQTAVVVGSPGEHIHTDEYGRVRVQFHWDRHGQRDHGSSCWMRVAQGWGGGAGFGSVAIPRVGQEVFVAFEQGNPDRPVVLGTTYNAHAPVPHGLPNYHTRSSWKSDVSAETNAFNEFMFEDLEQKELVYQQAQKDRVRFVKNDEFATVGHDREKLVKNNEVEQTLGHRKRYVEADMAAITAQNKREQILGYSDLTVVGSRREQIDGRQSIVVGGERHEVVEGNYALGAGKQIHIAGKESVIEAGDDMTIAGPGGFFRIDDSGVTIVGTVVRINAGGSPGAGRGASPLAPESPEVSEPGSNEKNERPPP